MRDRDIVFFALVAPNGPNGQVASLAGRLRMPITPLDLFDILEAHIDVSSLSSICINREDVFGLFAENGDQEYGGVTWEVLKIYRAILKHDFQQLMEKYLSASQDVLAYIGDALRTGDAATVRSLAEDFKSASVVFVAENVSNLAAQLEFFVTKHALEEASKLFKELHVQFEWTRKELLRKSIVLRASSRI